MKNFLITGAAFLFPVLVAHGAHARKTTECFKFSFSDVPTNGCNGQSQSFLMAACIDDNNKGEDLNTCKAVARRSTGAGCYNIDAAAFSGCIETSSTVSEEADLKDPYAQIALTVAKKFYGNNIEQRLLSELAKINTETKLGCATVHISIWRQEALCEPGSGHLEYCYKK